MTLISIPGRPGRAGETTVMNSKTGQASGRQSQSTLLPLTEARIDWLKSKIRDVPDFPKPGIVFKDLTTLIKDAEALRFVVDVLADKYRPVEPAYVAGIEARGFIVGAALAYNLGIGFVPIRKPGKLPYKVQRQSYELEYGTDAVEVHVDAVDKGSRTVLIDDLLATGGTACAAYQLLTAIGADVVGIGFITELAFLSGRQKLPADVDVFTMISY